MKTPTALLLSEHERMSERHQDCALRVSNPQLAFQTANDVLCFGSLACGEQLGDDGDLLFLGLKVNVR